MLKFKRGCRAYQISHRTQLCHAWSERPTVAIRPGLTVTLEKRPHLTSSKFSPRPRLLVFPRFNPATSEWSEPQLMLVSYSISLPSSLPFSSVSICSVSLDLTQLPSAFSVHFAVSPFQGAPHLPRPASGPEELQGRQPARSPGTVPCALEDKQPFRYK